MNGPTSFFSFDGSTRTTANPSISRWRGAMIMLSTIALFRARRCCPKASVSRSFRNRPLPRKIRPYLFASFLEPRLPMGSMGSGESIALGRYVLLRRLRMQGAVEVHLGLQRSVAGVETLVVIKRLTRTLAQEQRLADELLEEARVAGQLAHVNIAQVFDVGEDEGS